MRECKRESIGEVLFPCLVRKLGETWKDFTETSQK